MHVLVTGANGFIGKNLCLALSEQDNVNITTFNRSDNIETLTEILPHIDFVIHLAGVNRPKNADEFRTGNANLTADLCKKLRESGKNLPVLYASSIQASNSNAYGISKADAEQALMDYSKQTKAAVFIFRLPNIFGKWARPDYNSAIATFCFNIARGIPITINDPDAMLNLVYIDDVVNCFIQALEGIEPRSDGEGFRQVYPEYTSTVGAVAAAINSFKASRDSLVSAKVGTGLMRALYSTYVSYLPSNSFAYPVPMHIDARGTFVEMLKTEDSGQFSYFTAHPGVTRGGHYHHSKTEKFLVMNGKAEFRFRHMLTGETYTLFTSGQKAEIVETIPGWTHDITNIGNDELLVMLWANEILDRARPDTFACPI